MKVFRTTCVFILMVIFLPSWVSCAQSPAKDSYQKGFEYATQEKFILSNESYIRAWECYNKGVNYATQGKFEKAKMEFEKSLKIDEFNTAGKVNLLKIIKNIIEQKIEREAAIHLFKGVSFADGVNHDQAVEEFTKAIEISPRFVDAYLYRGFSYDVRCQYDQAIKEYTKAIKINPRYAMAYNARGFTYRKMDQYELAIKDYTKSIEIYSSDGTAYINRGLVYDDKGRRDQAIKDYNKAIEINPLNRVSVDFILSH